MRVQNLLLLACILGMLYSRWGLAILPDAPKQQRANQPTVANPATQAINASVNVPPEAEQARGKAREAQRIAIFASRKALKASEQAQSSAGQAGSGTTGYFATTNNQGYHYEGGWLNKQPDDIGYNGYGMLSWPNGNRYEGQFLKGRKNGYGVFTGPNGDRYEGGWSGGDINGYGRYVYPGGERYEGEYHNDNRHGYGVMIYPTGERYEGEWRDNEKNGYGVLSSFNGTVKYAGTW